MPKMLSKPQIEDLVSLCGGEKAKWRGDELTFCCPIHGEKNPSCGISLEKQVFNCFSCGARGNLAKFLYLSLPDRFGYSQIESSSTWYRAEISAWQFLEDRYELENQLSDKSSSVRRFEDRFIKPVEYREEIPLWKLAPYHSGKATYEYFFQRGFKKSDMKKFGVGYDDTLKTVTIPVFWEDGPLAGIIGRYLHPRSKNERYHVYGNFKRGNLLYPLNFFSTSDGTCILVEGILDAIRMHSLGYPQTLAIMSDNLSWRQVSMLSRKCRRIIYLGDNDERGLEAREKNRSVLSGKLDSFYYVSYPEHGKDCCDWTPDEIDRMVSRCFIPNTQGVRRWYG